MLARCLALIWASRGRQHVRGHLSQSEVRDDKWLGNKSDMGGDEWVSLGGEVAGR